jgi:hypothetical protein
MIMPTRKVAYRAIILLTALGLVFSQHTVFAWGNDGHVYINQVAAEKIPDSMPSFLRTRASIVRIAYLGPEPDRWRTVSELTLNNAQSPDHFIDLELVESLDELPKGRYEFYRVLYEKRASAKNNPDNYLPERVGLQPYITIEIYQRLKIAFHEYRKMKEAHRPTVAIEQDIVFYAGWLGHYVADGSQPLHTTVNYDGWVEANPDGFVTDRGIHRRFESDFLSRNIAGPDFSNLIGPAQILADPFAEYVKYLWASHALVRRVYQLDKAKAFEGSGSSDAMEFTERRLAAGAQMLLDLWYTAWIESSHL